MHVSDFLQWHAEFELGHDKIDQHHRHTFTLANQLFLAAKAKDHRAAVAVIETYLQHLRGHCAFEESLLRDARRHSELEQLSRAHHALIEQATHAYHQVASSQMKPERFFYDIIVISDITHHQMEDDRMLFRHK